MKKSLMILTILALACSKAQMPVAPEPGPVKGPDLQFSVLSDTVTYGETVAIEWESDGFRVVIDQGVGTRGPVGSEEVNFENPGHKVFTATAYNEANLFSLQIDSVYIKEALQPILPVMVLSTTNLVTVDNAATISWYSQNADYIVVDHVANPDFQGQSDISFPSPGIRIVTATAYNSAGYVSATDTIEVVTEQVTAVADMILSAPGNVRADRGETGFVDSDVSTFNIQTAGKYRINTEVWYNSGNSQLNESFYLDVLDQGGRVLAPQNPNAGVFKVVPDDPGKPHTASRESGIFNLTPGGYRIDLYHYAKIAGMYPQFINSAISGPESVKILGFRLEYLGE